MLVAEDDESVRTMVQKILAGAGYTVLEARHGADAVLVSREHRGRIDLLLTDVVMPELNGLRLAEVLGPERPDMEVIFMSGYTRDEVDRRGLALPGVTLIHKPFTVVELAMAVRSVLDGRRGDGQTGGRADGRSDGQTGGRADGRQRTQEELPTTMPGSSCPSARRPAPPLKRPRTAPSHPCPPAGSSV